MREIIFDTETTGLKALSGDRLVEIGCVEMVNRFPTGRTFHAYLNPERDMPQEAFAIHGLSAEFLSTKPLFADVAQEFADFIADAVLVAHNASFDVGFVNMEFDRVGMPGIPMDRVIDTVAIARKRFPGARVSLDLLCERFGISNAHRVKHGALLDAELLAEVYSELLGGRQAALGLDAAPAAMGGEAEHVAGGPARRRPQPLIPRLSDESLASHVAFVGTLGDAALWNKYRETTSPEGDGDTGQDNTPAGKE
jgi:DNA polymerase III subunit epsilon